MGVLDDLFGVAGKAVLITGGSRGIGEAIAEGFVAAGARVTICARNEQDCRETAERLSKMGHCVAVAADLSTDEGRHRLARDFAAREPKLDVLINNAGAIWAASLATYPESGWDKVYDLNVKGVFFLCQALLPLLEKAGTAADPARIINIGSINALRLPKHETYAYTSSKAALHHLSKHLAAQLAARHITVNVIAPGLFPSKILKARIAKEGEGNLAASAPLNRLTNAADMAGAALYLSSKAGSYLTGVVLPVDGGTTGAT